MKSFRLKAIGLIYCLIGFVSLTIYSAPENVTTVFRRIKSSQAYSESELKVIEIFNKVSAKFSELPFNPVLPRKWLKAAALLFDLGVPGVENILRNDIQHSLEEDSEVLRTSQPVDPDNEMYKEIYQSVKDYYLKNLDFDNKGFISYQDFINRIRIGDECGGRWYKIFGKIVMETAYAEDAETDDAWRQMYTKTIIHEIFHSLAVGFNDGDLEEGATDYLTLEVYTKPIEHYEEERKMVLRIVDIVGKENFLRWYMNGDYNSLRVAIGDKAVELLQLYDASLIYSPPDGIEDLPPYKSGVLSSVEWIIENRNNEHALEEFKSELLDYLQVPSTRP